MLKTGTILENRYDLRSQGPDQELETLYHAYDMETERPVDILVLEPPAGLDGNLLEDLMRTQRVVAGLGQKGLVSYEQAGTVEGLLYLVRPHVAGHTLASVLAHSGALSSHTVVEIAIGVCEALAPAHRAGLVHGGLSPHCLFLPEKDPEVGQSGAEVTVTDLGLLPALWSGPAAQGRPWGRKPYLSPEQAAGERVRPATDVYVIGCLMYLMLTGRPPFRAVDERVLVVQHLRQDPASLQVLVPSLPSQLVQIVHKALAKDPAGRYRNAGQLGHVLRSQLGLQSQPQASGPAPVLAGPVAGVALPSASPARSRSGLPVADAPPAQPQSWERMVVAPPPRRPPIRRPYELVEEEKWADESGEIDWLMLGLLIVALIAVLGLIPLWRTVYGRYSTQPPFPTPASVAPLPHKVALVVPEDLRAFRLGAMSQDPSLRAKPSPGEGDWLGRWFSPVPPPGSELEDLGVFCYNVRSAGPSAGGRSSARPDQAVWESSLRACQENCSTLGISQEPGYGSVRAQAALRL